MRLFIQTPGLPLTGEGLIERVFSRLLLRPAKVVDVTSLSGRFRQIAFQSPLLQGCTWFPGDWIKVKAPGTLRTRTYTAMNYDTSTGVTSILAYCGGRGADSQWAESVRPGDEYEITRPCGCRDLRDLAMSTVVFGDETSFGLAAALRHDVPHDDFHFLFEVHNRDKCHDALFTLGVYPGIAYERRPENEHLDVIAKAMLQYATRTTTFLMTGKAQSVQHIEGILTSRGISAERLRTRFHWTSGKAETD